MTDDAYDRLARNHEQLKRQVKALLVTEQRLHRTQRELERQVARIESLSDFTLSASRVRGEPAVLEASTRLLLESFAYDRAAVLEAREGSLHIESSATNGRREGELERSCRWDAPLPNDVRFIAGCGSTVAGEEPTVCAFDGSATGKECTGGFHVALPLVTGQKRRLLVASRCDSRYSHVESLASELDRPFLRLLAHHVEGALEGSALRERVYAVLEELPRALFVVSDDVVRYANGVACKLLGHESPSAIVGTPMKDITQTEFGGTERSFDGQALRTLETRLLCADGSSVGVDLISVPFRYDDRPATLVLAEDLTERATMRTQLVQADRLATVGALAAGVAHEINNPLTYVIMSLERLARELAAQPLERHARVALDGAERIRTIVTDLKSFGRLDGDHREPLDVERALDRVLALASYELRYRATVVRDYGSVPAIHGNEGRLSQAFLNLVINSAHAMDEADRARNRLRVSTRFEGGAVVVRIEDTGHGIAPEFLGRVFDPFFTTKAHGEGTGLGLSICKGIVESHGGAIGVESRVGEGTTFTLRLQAAKMRVSSAPETSQRRERRLVHELRVLVVDDEPLVASVVAELLRDRGAAEVVIAHGGREALDRLATSEFDVVFLDLMMPDVSGMDVDAWLTENRPGLRDRIVFVTGGAFTPAGRAFLDRARQPVVEKPVTDAAIEAALLRVVADLRSSTPSAQGHD